MKPTGIQQVVDNVTESEGKIVVTTTISLDRSALEQRAGLTDPLSDAHEFSPGRHSGLDGGISLRQIGPRTYLGLVNRRTRAHPLYIGDTLFLFVPRQHSLNSLAELVADLLRQIPPHPLRPEMTESLDMARIIQELMELGHSSSP
jgi:hypothetical protein